MHNIYKYKYLHSTHKYTHNIYKYKYLHSMYLYDKSHKLRSIEDHKEI